MANRISKTCKTSPIELIIFDCDGVLIDSEMIGNQVVQEELTQLGHYLSLEQYMEIGVGRRKEEEETILNQMGIQLPFEFWEKVNAQILESFALKLKAISGVKEILDRLEIKKCIASSSSRKRIELCLTVTNLLAYFQGLIFDGTMVTRGKPHPDIFLLAAQTLQVPPDRCLVIEDSIPGIQAGLEAGMRVWGFVGGKHCYPSYINRIQETEAEVVFDNMSQLSTLIQSANAMAY